MPSPTAILLLYYRGGLLTCCHMDGFREDEGALLLRIDEIERFFHQSATASKHRVWLNVDENRLNNALLQRIAALVASNRAHIVKLAIIGLGRHRRNFVRLLADSLESESLAFACFADAEEAKAYLL